MASTSKQMTQTFGSTTATTVTKLTDNGCFMIPANGPFGNKTIGPRTVIVPAEPLEWNEGTTYEYMTLVLAESGNSYISKRDVPAGTPVTDERYWIKSSDWNAQLAAIQNSINNVQGLVEMGFKIVDPSMSMTEIQNAIDTYPLIVFKSGQYQVDLIETNPSGTPIGTGFTIPSNRFIMMAGAVFNTTATTLSHYNVFMLNGTSNVTITGQFTINGDAATHVGSDGEWGHCLSIYDSSNIYISGGTFLNAWGDGLYIGKSNSMPVNVTVYNCNCQNCRRNGISVTAGENIIIDTCKFTDIEGTSPEAGLDIEPNENGDLVSCFVSNCVATNCAKEGFQVALHNNGGAGNAFISNFTVIDCNAAFNITASEGINISDITAIGCSTIVNIGADLNEPVYLYNIISDSETVKYIATINHNGNVTFNNAVFKGVVTRMLYKPGSVEGTLTFNQCNFSDAEVGTGDVLSLIKVNDCAGRKALFTDSDESIQIVDFMTDVEVNVTSVKTVAIYPAPFIGYDIKIKNTGESNVTLHSGSYTILRDDTTNLNTFTLESGKTIILTPVNNTTWGTLYLTPTA